MLAADPYVDSAKFARHGVERTDLDTLLRESDVVTLHCSLTAETRGLMDRRRLALLKPTAVLINTARGAVVDIDALCDALETHALAAAALDVLAEEPVARDARIFELGDRVLLSPHMVAANQGGTLGAAIPWATEDVLAALRGELPSASTTPKASRRGKHASAASRCSRRAAVDGDILRRMKLRD